MVYKQPDETTTHHFFCLISISVFCQNLHKNVNPFIGTDGHGHSYPGATTPFGMVQLSPDTRIDRNCDGCSGYHYSDKTIYGFSNTHLNGTEVSTSGDIMLVPTIGEPSFDNKIYSSTFSHQNEKASANKIWQKNYHKWFVTIRKNKSDKKCLDIVWK